MPQVRRAGLRESGASVSGNAGRECQRYASEAQKPQRREARISQADTEAGAPDQDDADGRQAVYKRDRAGVRSVRDNDPSNQEQEDVARLVEPITGAETLTPANQKRVCRRPGHTED